MKTTYLNQRERSLAALMAQQVVSNTVTRLYNGRYQKKDAIYDPSTVKTLRAFEKKLRSASPSQDPIQLAEGFLYNFRQPDLFDKK